MEFGPFVILGDDKNYQAQIGDELIARPNSVVPADKVKDVQEGSEAFQWQRDGFYIDGSTLQTYTIQYADSGATITCVYSFVMDGEPYSVVNIDPVSVPKAAPVATAEDPLDMALIGGHTTVYGFPPSAGTLNSLRNEYTVKGKPLSAIFKNMENKHAAGEK